MSDVLSDVVTRRTVAQTEQAKPGQVRNAAGGYVFEAQDDVRLHRFLTLGTDGGTYYTSDKDLTRENAAVVFRAVEADPLKVVAKIVEISLAGRAPKQHPGLFALAIVAAHGNDDGRAAALAAVPQVCRTGSTLATFVKYCEQFRGWGRGMRKAVGRWYDTKSVDKLAYQMCKYRQRDGFSHADLLRLSADRGGRDGVLPFDAAHAALYNWVTAKAGSGTGEHARHDKSASDIVALPDLIGAFEEIQATDNSARVVELIMASDGSISHEMIPDRFINDRLVWEALLTAGVPQGALLWNLGRLTRLGLGTGIYGARIVKQLQDHDANKRARMHPIKVLNSMRTYASGHGDKGKLTWDPTSMLVDGLDGMFYASFDTVEATGASTLLALDLSTSMTWDRNKCSGLSLTSREASVAMAMVTARVEPNHQIVGFTQDVGDRSTWFPPIAHTKWGHRMAGISTVDVSPRRRLDDNLRHVAGLAAGGTDCSLPMLWAAANKVEVDTFVIFTDNETYAGEMHVDRALEQYRQQMSRPARLVVAAMTATGSSLCDPMDPLSMDISGFDSSCPQLISDFSAGLL